ncbi:MAG: hypothetical protein HOP21_02835 [Methylotenera sp.]|nr:hypothetical protein [Methylotenera sp.]
MILFLDFDGVLHSALNAAGHPDDFNKLPLLENWLREYPEVDVVISSSWREIKRMEALREIFSEDLRQRVVDKCPIIPINEETNYYRYEEILTWIKLIKYDGLWLALDDAAHEFPPFFDGWVGWLLRAQISLTQRFKPWYAKPEA